MKIGILTWFFGANYGAKLHSYALWHVLEDLGHEVFFVGYYPDGYEKLNLRMNINCPHYKRHPIRYLRCKKRCSQFDEFSLTWPKTKNVKSAKDIDSLKLDMIICGSDAVFNLNHPLHTPLYFGVGINETRKISYAPCCENTSTNASLSSSVVESLLEFFALSARDENTKALIQHNIDLPVEVVLDPTFLYDFSEITSDFKWRDYLLMYTFSDWTQYKEQIIKYAKEQKLKIISIGRHYSWADVSLDAATVPEWLAAFHYTTAVFTDSFHGLCFSIKGRKQFVVAGRPDKTDKNRDLMRLLGIQKDFYQGEDFNAAISRVVDYEKVDIALSNYKVLSINYLKNSMSE